MLWKSYEKDEDGPITWEGEIADKKEERNPIIYWIGVNKWIIKKLYSADLLSTPIEI